MTRQHSTYLPMFNCIKLENLWLLSLQFIKAFFNIFDKVTKFKYRFLGKKWASMVAQLVKNLPAIGETWVRSLGWEDPLEQVMATHSSILAWRILWTEEPGRVAKSWT